MNKFLESALIALDAIWSAKLRSFMTVLGNIVAVTSIIAVVSLIQGLNASVKTAILNQAGADSFNIQQFPITRSDEEFEKVREQSRASRMARRARDPPLRQRAGRRRDGRRGRRRADHLPRQVDRQRAVQGCRREYVNFSSFDAERGRLMSPTEVDSARPVTVVGWQTADRLFGTDLDPLDKTIQIEGVHFRIVGVSAKRGIAARAVAGRVRGHPAGAVPDDLRSAALAVADREAARRLRRSRRRSTKRRSRCAWRAGSKPKQPDNFGIFTSDTILDIYHSATNGIFAVLVGVVGCRWWSAASSS